jgi:hypothetical protein
MNPARASNDGKNPPPHVDVDIVVARTQASARDARADDDFDDDDDALGDVIDASASFERANARARVATRRSHRARVVIGTKRVVIVVITTDEAKASCAGRRSTLQPYKTAHGTHALDDASTRPRSTTAHHSIVTLTIVTGVLGASPSSVGARSIASTTSAPSTTRPNTGC